MTNRSVEVPIAEQTWHRSIIVWRGVPFYSLCSVFQPIGSFYCSIFRLFVSSGSLVLLLPGLCPLRWGTEESAAMAAEPTEEAISSFISFTNSTREQAISLLKVSRSMLFSLE